MYIHHLKIQPEIHQIRCPKYEEISEMVYTYWATYPEYRERRAKEPLEFPTCDETFYRKGWITGRRGGNATRIEKYCRELEQMKICAILGYGFIFATHQAREKHENPTAVMREMHIATTNHLE